MKRQDVEKLLGAYAAGTLTEAERAALFEAALEDQALFDALAREQALKDTLEDPRHRAQVLASLDESAPSFWAWLRRPWPWALAATTAASVLLMVGLVRWNQARTTSGGEFEFAKVKQAATPAEQPAAPPAAAVEEKAAVAEPARPRASAAQARRFESPPAALQKKAELPEPPAVAPESLAAAPPQPQQQWADTRRSNTLPPAPAAAPALTQQQLARADAERDIPARSRGAGVVGGAVGGLVGAAAPPQTAESQRERIAASELRASKTSATRMLADTPPPARYTILRRGPDGRYAAAPKDAVFAPGDDLQLTLETTETLWTYVGTDRALFFSGLVFPHRQIQIGVPPQTSKLKIVTSRQELPSAFRPMAVPVSAPNQGVVEVTIRYQ